MKWKFEPKPEPASQGVACCDVVNRGAAFADGRIYFNTLDDHTLAVDAGTGQPVWNTKVGNINIGETVTMAPLVVKDKVLVGNSGGEFGVRGWVKALDAKDGHVVWTAYGTGPDRDVLIGSDFKPFYADGQGHRSGRHELAARCMADRRRHHVGLDLLRSRAEPDISWHR